MVCVRMVGYHRNWHGCIGGVRRCIRTKDVPIIRYIGSIYKEQLIHISRHCYRVADSIKVVLAPARLDDR